MQDETVSLKELREENEYRERYPDSVQAWARAAADAVRGHPGADWRWRLKDLTEARRAQDIRSPVHGIHHLEQLADIQLELEALRDQPR